MQLLFTAGWKLHAVPPDRHIGHTTTGLCAWSACGHHLLHACIVSTAHPQTSM